MRFNAPNSHFLYLFDSLVLTGDIQVKNNGETRFIWLNPPDYPRVHFNWSQGYTRIMKNSLFAKPLSNWSSLYSSLWVLRLFLQVVINWRTWRKTWLCINLSIISYNVRINPDLPIFVYSNRLIVIGAIQMTYALPVLYLWNLWLYG